MDTLQGALHALWVHRDSIGRFIFTLLVAWWFYGCAHSTGYHKGYVKGWSDKSRHPKEGPKV